MLQIGRISVPDVRVDKRDVITAAFGLKAEAVQRGGKVLMHKAAALKVLKQKTEVVGAVGLERTGCGIYGIAHFPGNPADPRPCFFADVLLLVERFADRGNGYPAASGNVF